jgi:hypothetical protein
VSELVAVGDSEDVGNAERLTDVALALHLTHVQGIAPDPLSRGPQPLHSFFSGF